MRLTKKYCKHYVCNAEPEVCDLQKRNPKDDDCCCDCAIQERMVDKLGAYENIGTLEECRAAVERMKPKKPLDGKDIEGNEYPICGECSAIVGDGDWAAHYCPDCGKTIDWNEREG